MESFNISDNSNSTDKTVVSESIVPPILQYFFGVSGNLIAMILLCRSSGRHKWKPFYRLVGCLAITDFCGIALVYPAVMVRYISGFTFDFPKELCEFVSFWFSFSFLSSALIVSAMSFDRFLAVSFPLLYRVSKVKRTNLILIVIWLFSACISSLNLVGVGSVKNFYPGSWCFLDFASKGKLERINTFIYSITGLLILLTTIFLNIAVVFSVRRRPKFSDSDRKRRRNEIFIIVFLFLIVTLFSICWIPFMVRMLINASSSDPKNGPEELLAVRMTISNAIVDPWIYIILRKENLKKILALVQRFRKKENLPTVFFTSESNFTRTDNVSNL
ncbi:prostaglandin E2 receptor EP4 subtype-like [Crassostrea angulata]|uniref:prostaglandin E2 receptor EP4 subtype-like n=1 Tax=Magallana angulata TaxID=2784310 RepID=UPI0022B11CB6|nr:prostaglandin E2 receptor EP4 subtype-like [Crassostrea angulata]